MLTAINTSSNTDNQVVSDEEFERTFIQRIWSKTFKTEKPIS